MNTQQALKKIDEIHSIVQASNRALVSGKLILIYGSMFILIPPFGYATQWLTFGHDFGPYQAIYLPLANGFFFWGLAILIGKLPFLKDRKTPDSPLHPLIRKAFSMVRPISVSLAGIIIVLSVTGQARFIYPMIFIILGILFSIYGKFSSPQWGVMAWAYIFGGLLFFYLRSLEIPLLDFYFLVFQGLSYLAMGWFLVEKEKANA